MGKRTKKKLSLKMAAICSIFTLIISITLGVLGFYTYYHNIVGQYKLYIETIVNIASSIIDVEDMERCIETGEKSEQYEKTQEELDNIKTQSRVEFIYVIRPLNGEAVDNAMYVWSAVTEEEEKEFAYINSLGDLSGVDFPREVYENFMQAMTGGQEILFIPNSTEEFDYMLTGLYPICGEDKEPRALIGVDIPMDEIYTRLHQYLLYVVTGTLVIGGIFLFLFLRVLRKSVVLPVIRMADSAGDFVRQGSGNPDPSELKFRDPGVNTGDEIQLLSESLKEMTSELVEYMGNLKKVTADRERISAELDVATSIQSSMLPCIFPAFPERTEFDIYASIQVAQEMGGSFYDLFLVDQNHLALVIGEIGGRGIPAALLMVITKTLIKNHAQLGYSPDKVLTETNNQLSESNEGMTTTAFLGIVDLTTGVLTYANAGHSVPLLKHAGKDFAPLPTKNCFVLGSMAGVPYWQQSIQLVQGDFLFLYTKGLVEAENPGHVQYSQEHMQMRLNQVLGEAYMLEDISRILTADVEDFLEGAALSQDIAMLFFRFFGQ